MKKYCLVIVALAMLMSACGTAPASQQEEQAMVDTLQAAPVVLDRELSTPDAAVFGLIQFGRVKTITTDDILSETPEINFNERGELQASTVAEVVIRDKQGRPAVHNGGALDKDTIGFVFRTNYTFIGESNQVATVISDNTVNQTVSKSYRRYTYQEDLIYPATMFELQKSGQWPSANYSVYTYTRMDDEGNWLERTVKNYYFERPEFLSPEVMDQLRKDEAMQAAEQELVEHLEEATATEYTEARTIIYYE